MLATPDGYVVVTTPVGLLTMQDHGDSGEQVAIALFGESCDQNTYSIINASTFLTQSSLTSCLSVLKTTEYVDS